VQGLVERIRSTDDRRVVLNRLTPSGRRLHERKDAELTARWEAALADLEDEELEAGTRVMQRVREFFDDL
jgi:DNA-binding MarR family transcriptional regulator